MRLLFLFNIGEWILDIKKQTEAELKNLEKILKKDGAEAVLKNLEKILKKDGAGLEHVVDITVFLTDMGDYK
eukprot:Awhi_evm1s4651